MAALAANASRTLRNTTGKTKHTYTIKTSAVIYKHSLVAVNPSNVARVCADDASGKFAGLAVTASTGTFPVTGDGTKTVDLYNNLEVSMSLETNVTKAFTMTDMHATTDNDLAFSTTGGAECGTLTEWTSANNGYVFLGRKFLSAGT